MTSPDLLAEGRALLAAATPGPWEVAEEIDGVLHGRRTVLKAGEYPARHRVVTVDQTRRHHRDAAEANIELIAWMRNNLGTLLVMLEAAQNGGKALGDIVRRLQDAALDATGLHHIISEDGDGDWAAVWENVADLGAQARRLTIERDDARTAIGIVQAQHEAELTRIAGRRANYRRQIAGLTAKVAKLEGAA